MHLRAAPSCGDVTTVRRQAVTVCRQAATSAAAARPAPSTSRCHHSAGQRGRPRPELAARLPTRLDPRRLRRVEINHIGFDGKIHRGDLIVHEDVAVEVGLSRRRRRRRSC
jgi:hypothetical protein